MEQGTTCSDRDSSGGGLALQLRSFGVAFGDRVVLESIDLDLFTPGLLVLVGPAGGGKSTLLRTLAGLNDTHPALLTWGARRVFPGVNGTAPGPAMVMQHARFFLDTVRENLVSALPDRARLSRTEQTNTVLALLGALGLAELGERLSCLAFELPLAEQRKLAIARMLVPGATILFADEPTAGLADEDASDIVALLQRLAQRQSVVFVTHNQRSARAAGGSTALLAGGRIVERAPTRDFFSSPQTALGAQFVRTGGCDGAPAAAQQNSADPDIAGMRAVRSRFVGPRGFFWIHPGRLGGAPRPGIVDRLEQDIEGLARLGTNVLITLEEAPTVSAAAFAKHGIRTLHFPTMDMGAPEVSAAIELCTQVHTWITSGLVVVYHCRAGLGRTGTLLACQLVLDGRSAGEAVDAVRRVNPKCIQSEHQVRFISDFELAVRR